MSLREIGAVLRRRWYVVGVVVLLAAIGGWYVTHPKPSYEATAVIRLEPPRMPRIPNQYVDFRPALSVTDNAVTQVLMGPPGTARLRAAGVTGTYAIAPKNTGTVETPRFDQPWLQLTADASDPATADREVDAIHAEFDTQLLALQQQWGVAPDKLVTTNVLVPTSAAPVHGVKSRTIIGVGVLGFCSAVLLPLWFDEILRNRRRRAASAQPQAT